MIDISKKLGNRIISNLDGIPEVAASIEELGNICDLYSGDSLDNGYGENGSTRERILEWAYAGCVVSGMKGRDYKKDLKSFTDGIKQTLEENEFSDPVFYVQEVFNRSFK